MLARWIALLSLLFAVVALPRSARADSPGTHTVSVAVLAFDSEDAEDQADALTGALRSRIRAAQGWSLLETTQSLGMLAAAMKCPTKPLSLDCQQKIGEQIKAERYIYGYVTKGPQTGQVTAEVHLYQKNKQETVVKESYADNLKDQNDDTLRKIAQRILDRLGGNTVGVVVVKVEGATEGGEVVVDGDKRVPLVGGTARIDLAPGSHSIEVTSGSATTKRTIVVNAGKETLVEVSSTITAEPPKEGEKSGFPTRKVIGGLLMTAGAVAGTIAVINLVGYLDATSADWPERQGFWEPSGCNNGAYIGSGVQAEFRQAAIERCEKHDQAQTHSAIAWATGPAAVILLGAGAYLFFSSGGRERGEAPKPVRTTRVTPTLGGLSISGTF